MTRSESDVTQLQSSFKRSLNAVQAAANGVLIYRSYFLPHQEDIDTRKNWRHKCKLRQRRKVHQCKLQTHDTHKQYMNTALNVQKYYSEEVTDH